MVSRTAVAADPRSFGRRAIPLVDADPSEAGVGDSALLSDLKLFGSAFLAGFLFVAAYIA